MKIYILTDTLVALVERSLCDSPLGIAPINDMLVNQIKGN